MGYTVKLVMIADTHKNFKEFSLNLSPNQGC